MAETQGVTKRMRKGTKSCLPCRRRKTRCSLRTPGGGPCKECASRGDLCASQGVIDNDPAQSTNRRLRERVLQLEARLQQLQPDIVQTSPESDSAAGALSDLLLRVQGTSPSSRVTTSTGEDPEDLHTDGRDHLDEEEESLDTAAAPLMSLLANPILGRASASDDIARTSHALRNPSLSSQHHVALRDLCTYLPSPTEMHDILTHYSSWWPLYRSALGLQWGDDDDDDDDDSAKETHATLASFATSALRSGQPAQLGLLLACFAIGTGAGSRFLPPVERRIVAAEGPATEMGSEHGLACLVAVGLVYLAALQPRRAWGVYRRANGLLQLRGWHRSRHRRRPRHRRLFWQLLHADRWCSLMIGLPYAVPDHLCDVEVEDVAVLGPATFLYRRLAVLTGRVIDCLQHVQGPVLAAALEVDEQLAALRALLPEGYLSMAQIRGCADREEKVVRLYRVVHFCQLRAYVHLPFLLRSGQEGDVEEGRGRYEYSRRSCVDDARQLLEAYLEMADDDLQAVYDGTVLNFNAFTAAVILLLHLLGYGRPRDTEQNGVAPSQLESDWRILYRTMDVLRQGAERKIAARLCKGCFEALQSLVANARSTDDGDLTRRVVLPYFGTLEITRRTSYTDQSTSHSTVSCGTTNPTSTAPVLTTSSLTGTNETSRETNIGVDMSFAYRGPFMPETNVPGDGFDSTYTIAGGDEWSDGLGLYNMDWDWWNDGTPLMK